MTESAFQLKADVVVNVPDGGERSGFCKAASDRMVMPWPRRQLSARSAPLAVSVGPF